MTSSQTTSGPPTVPEPIPDRPPPPPAGVKTMAVVRWILVIVTAVVATLSILSYAGVHVVGGAPQSSGHLYYCPMHPSVVQDHPGECPICSMTLVPKPEGKVKASATMKPAAATDGAGASADPGAAAGKYYCPMHPNRTSDDPKAKCPDCSMKLELRPAAAAGAPAGSPPGHTHRVPGLSPVDLSAERIQLIGMRTAVVKREALAGALRTVGVVTASERGLAQINTRFSGWIQKLLVSQTGEQVRRGQVLAMIYSPEVLKAQQEFLVARGWGAGAGDPTKAPHEHDSFTSQLDSGARQRLELLGISSQEIEEISRTGKPVEAIAIRSPVDGYVIGKNAVAGLAIQPGTVLFEVADLRTVWVTADIYERDVPRVRMGQPARLELAAYPGETHAGKIQFIHPIVSSENRTLQVRIEFKNRSDRSGPRLRPGMYGTVYLDLPATMGLMVSSEAVVDTGEIHYVFALQQGGHFEPRMVKLGPRVGDKIEITSGVSEGETLVTTGNFLVDSESRLRAAIEGLAGAAAPAGGGGGQGSSCETDFDGQKYPDKLNACKACEIQHRGMGTMEEDCKKAIAKPWR